jgi:hypothetical protein
MESNNTKWLVIGVILIFTLLLFQPQIGRLLDRTTDLNIADTVKIKSAETTLGETEVSKVSVKTNSEIKEGIQGTTYTSREYNFQISWPDNRNWYTSTSSGYEMEKQLKVPPSIKIPFVIFGNDVVDNFRPNVNVVVEQVGDISISQYMDSTLKSFEQIGWEVLSSNVDDVTQGGFIESYQFQNNKKLYQFQRIVIDSGRAYIITSTELPPNEDLRFIMNSFRIIT